MTGAHPLVFQLGTGKTGTTSLQEFLAANRRHLARQGFAYPDTSPYVAGPRFHHNSLAAAGLGSGTASAAVQAFLADLEQPARRGLTPVLSSEVVFGATFADPARSATAAQFAHLRDQLSGFDVHPVIYLRRQDSFAESWYAQAVKHRRAGGPWPAAGSFAEFRAAQAGRFDYDAIVTAMREAFGSVTVLRYEDGAVIAQFLGVLGVPMGTMRVPESSNRSPDARVGLWLRGTPVGTTAERDAFTQSDEATSLFAEVPRATFWQSPAERDDFLATFADHEYGAKYFPAPRDLGPTASLDAEDARAVAAAYTAWSRRVAIREPIAPAA